MKKISEQNRRHLEKKAAKGQNRWKPPRSKLPRQVARQNSK